jgi:hypothetical protein
MHLEEIRRSVVDWIHVADDWDQLRALVNARMNLSV